ncbi:MAG: hypothetical protein DRP02_02270 [Candidatus Gerdarchaeota archaeon]|nr:MAG: hypothetical protein DRP02_02270 [Candidatus Gerdarchaeota archaeon]
MIKLTITKHTENPDYEKELDNVNRSFRGAMHHDMRAEDVNKHIVEGLLTISITEKQFETIRKEVLKEF